MIPCFLHVVIWGLLYAGLPGLARPLPLSCQGQCSPKSLVMAREMTLHDAGSAPEGLGIQPEEVQVAFWKLGEGRDG